MKKFVTLLWMVATIGCMTLVAYADAIVGPVALTMHFIYYFWPWFLVAIVVLITVRLLRKYRKK